MRNGQTEKEKNNTGTEKPLAPPNLGFISTLRFVSTFDKSIIHEPLKGGHFVKKRKKEKEKIETRISLVAYVGKILAHRIVTIIIHYIVLTSSPISPSRPKGTLHTFITYIFVRGTI